MRAGWCLLGFERVVNAHHSAAEKRTSSCGYWRTLRLGLQAVASTAGLVRAGDVRPAQARAGQVRSRNLGFDNRALEGSAAVRSAMVRSIGPTSRSDSRRPITLMAA